MSVAERCGGMAGLARSGLVVLLSVMPLGASTLDGEELGRESSPQVSPGLGSDPASEFRTAEEARQVETRLRATCERAAPAVVAISRRNPTSGTTRHEGTGVVIDASGVILTHGHHGQTSGAVLQGVYAGPVRDFSLLKIRPPGPFPCAPLRRDVLPPGIPGEPRHGPIAGVAPGSHRGQRPIQHLRQLPAIQRRLRGAALRLRGAGRRHPGRLDRPLSRPPRAVGQRREDPGRRDLLDALRRFRSPATRRPRQEPGCGRHAQIHRRRHEPGTLRGRSPAIIGTSVLVNFLALDRADHLARHPLHRFVVVDLVRDEVVKRTSSERLLAAFQAGYVLPDGPPEAVAIEEFAAFAAISLYDVLGHGECAASAAAHARGLPLFMDDGAAWKKVDLAFPGMAREGTATLVAAIVKSGVVDVAQADAMKADWEANHRFRLKFASFLEIL